METTNNVQKTENRRIRINITKIFAVVVSLVLVSLTVSANGFWKQVLVNNSYGKMAIMMVDQANRSEAQPIYSENNLAPSTDVTATSAIFMDEVIEEKTLEVELWMIKDSNFGSTRFEDELCIDQPLKIEDWMIDDSNFSSLPESGEKEPALKVESWMINQQFWGR